MKIISRKVSVMAVSRSRTICCSENACRIASWSGWREDEERELEGHGQVDVEGERAHARGARAPVKIISRKVSVMKAL